jgi:hypothetical protein
MASAVLVQVSPIVTDEENTSTLSTTLPEKKRKYPPLPDSLPDPPHPKARKPYHRHRCPAKWTQDEERSLRAGIRKYGYGNWALILSKMGDQFHENRQPQSLAQRANQSLDRMTAKYRQSVCRGGRLDEDVIECESKEDVDDEKSSKEASSETSSDSK